MQIKIEKVKILLFLFLFPLISLAAIGSGPLADFVDKLLAPVRAIPGLLMAFALAYFLYGVLGYTTATDEKKRREGKDTIVYGIFGLFVMTSVWGIVEIVRSLFGI